ncbi:MAG TPA: hypothetical protein VGE51_16235 [Fontimonas sp.]
MAFGFARRRHDELGAAAGGEPPQPDADPLARFADAAIDTDHEDGDQAHPHGDSCPCRLRGV